MEDLSHGIGEHGEPHGFTPKVRAHGKMLEITGIMWRAVQRENALKMPVAN